MHKQGISQIETAKLLGVNRNSVYLWCKKYKEEGSKGLQEKRRGNKLGDGRLLSAEQEKAIQSMIIDRMPEQLKLLFGLWTRKAIKELIKREYQITIAIRTVEDYLKRWNFSPQNPKKIAYEQNPKVIKRWLEEEYPLIKEQAKAVNIGEMKQE